MIGKLTGVIEFFFLHIEINTLNLPYWKLPRPYQSHLISRFFRRIFERQSMRQVLGFNLAALAAIPIAGQVFLTDTIEPPLNVVIPEVRITDSLDMELEITTQERQYIVPVERLRFVGQYFKSGHPGYDLNSYVGDDILAFTSGYVQTIESGTLGLGRYVVLDHGHGLVSVYGHMKDFSVEVGQLVKTGEKIGEVGMTGYTTGPHLHFEVHDNGVAVNPGNYLKL